jgi:hypothetical protein
MPLTALRTTSSIPNTKIIQYLAGQVSLAPGRLWVYPAALGWLRMQELHLRATGASQGFVLAASFKPSPERAAQVFVRAQICALAEHAVLSDEDRGKAFVSLLEFVEHHRSLAGLEAPFFTAWLSCASAGQMQRAGRAADLWKKVGMPSRLGGGKSTTPILVTGVDTISFVNAHNLAAAASKLSASAAAHVSVGEEIVNAGQENADGKEICQGFFTVVGGIAGGVATKSMSGVSGGAALGLGGGKMVCDGVVAGVNAAGDAISGYFAGPTVGRDGAGGAPGQSTNQGPTDLQGDPNQSNNDPNQSNNEPNQSIDPNQNSSDPNQNSSDPNQGDPNQSSSGTPNPDDPGGTPNPDDPGGIPDPDAPGGMPVSSNSFLVGAGLANLYGQTGACFALHSVPRLNTGAESLASSGVMGGFGMASSLHAVEYTPPDASRLASSGVAQAIRGATVDTHVASPAAAAGRVGH